MARLKRAGNEARRPRPTTTAPAPAEHSSTPWFRVSGWRLRNKIALALAFPVISAAWFATDKAIESFIVQESHQATAGQVRVLAPALDFLYAAQESYVQTLLTAPGSAERRSAAQEVQEAAEALTAVSTSEALNDNQRVQIKNIAAWADDLTNTDVVRVTTATNSQASQLNSAVSDYLQTIINGQVVPEATLQQINDVMSGYIALTQQRIYTAYDGNEIKNQPDLFQYIGIERGAIESLADARPAGDPDTTNLRSQNVQRQSLVVLGKGELRYDTSLNLYDVINATVLEESLAALDANAQEAQNKAFLNLTILVLAILATLLFAWLIARLILNPVRAVRDGAIAVATEQLPEAVALIRSGHEPDEIEPIKVHTNEEMGQLARAVDDLHRTAVTLASGEAKLRAQVGEMFVTLSRRNTSLINQQLGLIEELERDEQDPRRLENLFRLDHLAARMRRTAESLVILSDAPVRQRDAAALPVTDALQAATAGVQEYQRVELRGGTESQLEGSAANDLVHLLTELIDNALSFSPPTAPVEVDTSADPTGVRIEISDGGLGIPTDMLNQLNTMLSADLGMTPDAARRMGLFVVSRLAQRHSLEVRLTTNHRGGVTAVVTIPGALIVGGATALSASSTPSASAALAPTPGTPEAPASTAIGAAALAAVPDTALNSAPDAAQGTVEVKEPSADDTTRSHSSGDVLSSPLPAPAETLLPPAAEPDQAPGTRAIPALGDPLPKRRPGATVPTRTAAVSPTGSSLFGGASETGGLFDRPADDTAEAEATGTPDAEAPLPQEPTESVSEPQLEDLAQAAPEEVPAEASAPIGEDAAPETPTSTVEPLDEASVPEIDVLDPLGLSPDPTAHGERPPLPFQSLPAIDADVPVTPATTDSTVSMFGGPGEDTRTAPERTEADEATVAARMGMFNALARGSRGGHASAPTGPTPTLPLKETAQKSNVLDEPAETLTIGAPVAGTAEPAAIPEASPEPAHESAPSSILDDPLGTHTSVLLSTPSPDVETPPVITAIESPTPAVQAAPPTPSPVPVPAEAASGWLSQQASTFENSTVDAGWAAAAKVAKHVETTTTGAGLPQRRPGQRLVPGAAAPTKTLPPRDPEAIRRRLASHAAGVSRGRSATVAPTSRAQEEGQA